MNVPGVGFVPRSDLLDSALEAICEGPVETEELARRVFRLRAAPPGLAARLVYELLGSDGRASVDPAGVWRATEPGLRRDAALSEIEFAVVDVETTGGSPARGDRVLEFACVRMRAGQIVSSYETLLSPGVPIPSWISGLTGIRAVDVEGAPRFEDVAERVRAELAGRVFVAHNVAFDWRFVSAELQRCRSEMPAGERLCTVKLARRALPGLHRRGLDSLVRYYGVTVDARHRAGGDARATAEILARMLEEADRRGVDTWSRLQAWLTGRPAPVAVAEPGRGASGAGP